MNLDAPLGHRPLGRGALTGVLVTVGIHGLLALFVYVSQVRATPPAPVIRDLIATRTITLGKPREKFWLPRIVTPPPPVKPPPEVIKIANNPDAAAAPPPPPKPKDPPKPDDRRISSDLKRALQRAKALSQAAQEEPPEGSLTGSAEGNSSSAEEGESYATQVHDAIKKYWTAPSGLFDESALAALVAEVRVRIAQDGQLGSPVLVRPSGNQLFDDSVTQAVRSAGRVPPIPPASRARFRNGVVIEFKGKDLAR